MVHAENAQLLNSKQSSLMTNKKKQAKWQKMVDAVNANIKTAASFT